MLYFFIIFLWDELAGYYWVKGHLGTCPTWLLQKSCNGFYLSRLHARLIICPTSPMPQSREQDSLQDVHCSHPYLPAQGSINLTSNI